MPCIRLAGIDGRSSCAALFDEISALNQLESIAVLESINAVRKSRGRRKAYIWKEGRKDFTLRFTYRVLQACRTLVNAPYAGMPHLLLLIAMRAVALWNEALI
jgi:hypothetical protein